jgi:hypothetical protein
VSRIGARGALILVALAAAAVGGAWVARGMAQGRVEDALRARGLSWGAAAVSGGTLSWSDITGPGVRARALVVDLVPSPRARIEGVDVDAEAALQGRAEGGGGAVSGGGVALPVRVVAEDVTVRFGDVVLLEAGQGTLAPRLAISGEGGAVARTAEGWNVALSRDVDEGGVSGTAHVEVTCDAAACEGLVRLDAPVLAHPLLAPKPVELGVLMVEGTWARDTGVVSGTARIGPAVALVSGHLQPEPLAGALDIEVTDLPLEDVVGAFGRQIPEAARAEIVGEIGLSASVDLSTRAVQVRPRAAGLGAGGVLSDPLTLRNGRVTWKAPGATADDWVMKTTGHGTAYFTPLARAGLMPEAVIASEDAGFWRHKGYDLAAIQEALDQKAAAPDEPLRGGSTLTQQLAKNLFLDGRDRTLVRKLRELLYALELERTVGKERILELYLNIVELGPDLHGVGPAADAYFIKTPDRLTPREAAFLAVLLPSPRRLAERAWLAGRTPDARIDAVLDNMVDGKALTRSRAEQAKRAPLRIVPPPR